jgi:rhodanese-related sulfurtransferase
MINSIVIAIILIPVVFAQIEDVFEEYLEDLSAEFEIEQIQADSVNLSKAIILDAREIEEYDVSRLKNAILIGYDDFDMSLVDSLGRDEEIIVYCSVGYRSSVIGVELKKSGFKNVKNLYGGIFKWANDGRPLFNDSMQTNEIHAYNRKWGRYLTNPELIKVY